MIRGKGFTLVELAMALFIIALLLAGALIPLSTQIDVRSAAETQRTMDSIREAIIGFAQANGRLPCPADGTIPAGGTDAVGRPAGTEQLNPTTLPPPATAICQSSNPAGTNAFGVVPWTTLGVPETDSWGRRFSYQVSAVFADGLGAGTYNTAGQNPTCMAPVPTPTQSSFALCSMGLLTVKTRNETSLADNPIGSQLPAVIISHGKNGSGAYTRAGTVLPAPSGPDEIFNAAHDFNAHIFFSRVKTPAASGCNDTAGGSFCEFDDIVVMIPSSVLMARMVAAGKLP